MAETKTIIADTSSSSEMAKPTFYEYFHDLEADAVLHLKDGRYALIEFKLGSKDIDMGAKHLCEIERLIAEYNKYDLYDSVLLLI